MVSMPCAFDGPWMLTFFAAYYTFNPSLKELKDQREGTSIR
jgi:hypothetical protein